MNENLNFESYFGTPVYAVELPELVKNLNKISNKFILEAKKNNEELIKNRQKNFKKKIGDFGLSHHSKSLINESGFKDIRSYVEERSFEILDHIGYDLTDYKLKWSEMWLQEFAKNGGGHHEGHIHYNTHISGFYFLKCSDKTSYPIFHDPRSAKTMSDLPLKNEDEISLGSSKINVKPKPGTLILFPSYLRHGFSLDLGLEPYRFIHFNLQVVKKDA